MSTTMDRRHFLKTTSLGSIGLTLWAQGISAMGRTKELESFQPNRFLIFRKDGHVELFTGRAEMGQGTNTSIRMLVAEELRIDPEKIIMTIKSPTDKFRVSTGGSHGLLSYYRSARPIFASARQLFINAAAQKWNLAPGECRLENGYVIHPDHNHENRYRLGYHELLDVAASLDIPEDVEPIPRKDFKYLGESKPLDHLEDILTGKLLFGLDHSVEGMLCASIERCPVIGGKLKSYDASKALKIEGVIDVLPIEGTEWEAYDFFRSGVAVLARDSWAAQKARKALDIEWEEGPNSKIDSAYINLVFEEKLKEEGKVFKSTGDIKEAFQKADETLESTYDTPFWSHSPIETMNTLVDLKDNYCEVWTPCHAQTRLLEAIKRITGFTDGQITIHTTFLGGSFGRRLLVDYGIEALLLSQAAKAPVQLLYDRVDETKFGHFLSGGKFNLKASINNNRPSGIHIKIAQLSIYSQREPDYLEDGIDYAIGDDFLRFPYEFPTQQFEQQLADEIQVPVTWFRGTYGNCSNFVTESFLDEIAVKIAVDPLQFRLSLLEKDEEPFKVRGSETIDKKIFKKGLEKAAELSGWSQERKKGHGKGIAVCYSFFNSYATVVAEVTVSQGKQLKINKITCVAECGFAVNPDMVKAQLEGGVVWALSAMNNEITFENGRVVQSTFWDYPILDYGDCPDIDVHILESDRPAYGVGELSNMPTFAAVCNAIYDASGIRVRALPLTRYFG